MTNRRGGENVGTLLLIIIALLFLLLIINVSYAAGRRRGRREVEAKLEKLITAWGRNEV